ncbi:MAG: succinyldiaminopimelate transaminase [Gammaproteobacteria bacterium]|jgi:N-succinyldiaminopimelate aminotransferase
MNPHLQKLRPYPFERLRQLKQAVKTPTDYRHLALSLGEPRDPAPNFIKDVLTAALDDIAVYPTTQGSFGLRQAIAQWLSRRFSLAAETIDPDRQVIPVAGTREALFALAQCIINPSDDPLVFMPNPFYQIYEGAALLAGATPYYLNCTEANGFLPDLAGVSKQAWERCQLFYLCSPGNPTGAVAGFPFLQQLIELADRYDFVIAADECYSEIYLDESHPPVGLLEAAARLGRFDYRRCLVFHSLSKRSNVPGLRTGFVAGDATLIEHFLRYRTYHGCAMPLHTQAASAAAWQDEAHVRDNRERYRRKFQTMKAYLKATLPFDMPAGGFYLWPKTPCDDVQFALQLFQHKNVTVLPGTYLSRTAHGSDPGYRRVRIALVPSLDDCTEAADRMAEFISTQYA